MLPPDVARGEEQIRIRNEGGMALLGSDAPPHVSIKRRVWLQEGFIVAEGRRYVGTRKWAIVEPPIRKTPAGTTFPANIGGIPAAKLFDTVITHTASR